MQAMATPAQALAVAQKKAAREALELAMLQHIRAVGLERGMVRQYVFHTHRKWAFDFAWPQRKVAIEVDGGTFINGRHNRGKGYTADCEKLAEAVILGWRVLRATGSQVKAGTAVGWLERILRPAPVAVPAPERELVSFPKREYVRSPVLREAYRLIPCQRCGADDGTVCCAHSNWSVHGKGGAIKADDSRGASLCHGCHMEIDQGSTLPEEERQSQWWDAHVKSVQLLRRLGHWPKHVPFPDVDRYPF